MDWISKIWLRPQIAEVVIATTDKIFKVEEDD